MTLERRTQALLGLVEDDRRAQCAAIAEEAGQQAAAALDQARAEARQRVREAFAEERARLAALPGVAEAHRGAVAWHRERIAGLRQRPDYAALFDEITGPRLEKLSRMTPNFGSAIWYAGPGAIPDAVAARDTGEAFYFNG